MTRNQLVDAVRVCIRPLAPRGWEVTTVDAAGQEAAVDGLRFLDVKEASDAATELRSLLGIAEPPWKTSGTSAPYQGPVQQ